MFSFAAELVMMSMGGLPKEIPPLFNNTYTPIAAAGTETQVSDFYLICCIFQNSYVTYNTLKTKVFIELLGTLAQNLLETN